MKPQYLAVLLAAPCLLNASAQTPRLIPFQARLADAAGKPIPDGATVVQFQIFGDPTNTSPVWAGEVHRTTINGGLLNVALGTKNPFPLNRTNEAGAALSFFDATLYLEVTVDSTGNPNGTPDGTITKADPPLLPRQAILPVLFATEAGNSLKLAGADWSAVFGAGATNPATAQFDGNRILGKSVTADQIRPGTITSNEIAAATIIAANLSAQLVQDSLVPPGTIVAFGGSTDRIQAGWLLCDGRSLNQSAYPRLYTAISTNWGGGFEDVRGTMTKTGDFNLPDLRGFFLRGVQGERGSRFATDTNPDPDATKRVAGATGGATGNAVGTFQADSMPNHIHDDGSLFAMITHSGGVWWVQEKTTASWSYDGKIANDSGDNATGTQREAVDVGGTTGVVTGTPTGESRPKNAYVHYLIKL